MKLVKKWINSVCILTVEPAGFPESLDVDFREKIESEG